MKKKITVTRIDWEILNTHNCNVNSLESLNPSNKPLLTEVAEQ